jgi:hypothetical protein
MIARPPRVLPVGEDGEHVLDRRIDDDALPHEKTLHGFVHDRSFRLFR